MSQIVDAIGGVPLVIHWKVIGHVFFTWEIGIEAVEKILPPASNPSRSGRASV
jgi:hypothetical protein